MLHGCDLNEENSKKETPLHFATANEQTETVKWLLEHGANVDVKNWDDSTALHIAARGGFLAITEMLVSAGANINNSSSKSKLIF
jgi:ankyrin repeat protein